MGRAWAQHQLVQGTNRQALVPGTTPAAPPAHAGAGYQVQPRRSFSWPVPHKRAAPARQPRRRNKGGKIERAPPTSATVRLPPSVRADREDTTSIPRYMQSKCTCRQRASGEWSAKFPAARHRQVGQLPRASRTGPNNMLACCCAHHAAAQCACHAAQAHVDPCNGQPHRDPAAWLHRSAPALHEVIVLEPVVCVQAGPGCICSYVLVCLVSLCLSVSQTRQRWVQRSVELLGCVQLSRLWSRMEQQPACGRMRPCRAAVKAAAAVTAAAVLVLCRCREVGPVHLPRRGGSPRSVYSSSGMALRFSSFLNLGDAHRGVSAGARQSLPGSSMPAGRPLTAAAQQRPQGHQAAASVPKAPIPSACCAHPTAWASSAGDSSAIAPSASSCTCRLETGTAGGAARGWPWPGCCGGVDRHTVLAGLRLLRQLAVDRQQGWAAIMDMAGTARAL